MSAESSDKQLRCPECHESSPVNTWRHEELPNPGPVRHTLRCPKCYHRIPATPDGEALP